MRKLVHEEVDREIANKSVNIAIKMLKPELDQLMKGLSKAVQAPVKAAGKAAVNKIHPTTGKQSVKTLIRQGQGVSSIPLADEGLKDFQKIAKKYGVDFAVVKDKEASPPVYTVFSRRKIRMPSQGFCRIILQNRSRSLPQIRLVFWRNLKNSRRLWQQSRRR